MPVTARIVGNMGVPTIIAVIGVRAQRFSPAVRNSPNSFTNMGWRVVSFYEFLAETLKDILYLNHCVLAVYQNCQGQRMNPAGLSDEVSASPTVGDTMS